MSFITYAEHASIVTAYEETPNRAHKASLLALSAEIDTLITTVNNVADTLDAALKAREHELNSCDWLSRALSMPFKLREVSQALGDIQQQDTDPEFPDIKRQLRKIEKTRTKPFDAFHFVRALQKLDNKLQRAENEINRIAYNNASITYINGFIEWEEHWSCSCHKEIREVMSNSLEDLCDRIDALRWDQGGRLDVTGTCLADTVDRIKKEKADAEARKEWEDEMILTKLWPVS